MIYLDNAATSYPKPASVINAVIKSLKYECGNPGRSSHRLSLAASEAIFAARESICGLLNIEDPERVVFTYNATEALNLAIKTRVKEKCHVITSDLEHNSVVRPIYSLSSRSQVEVSEFNTDENIAEEIKRLIRPDTKGIVTTAMSNVTGKQIDIEQLGRIARQNKLFLIVDASQMLGHYRIDLSKLSCDVLCAPAHKGLLGIMGLGFAVFKEKVRLESFIEGGSGSDSLNPAMPLYLPDGYEAGTPATPAIAALRAGIEYLGKHGIESISRHLDILTDEARVRLYSINGIDVHAAEHGIISISGRGISSTALSSQLSDRAIATRGGYHCAPSAHKKLGTLKEGTVRLSFSHATTLRELDALYKALKEIIAEV